MIWGTEVTVLGRIFAARVYRNVSQVAKHEIKFFTSILQKQKLEKIKIRSFVPRKLTIPFILSFSLIDKNRRIMCLLLIFIQKRNKNLYLNIILLNED